MTLLNYNEDIIYSIFNEINNGSEVFKFRLINKLFNEIFINYFKSIMPNIIPRSTFINIRKCNVCNKLDINHHQLIYKFGSLPSKCIIHCMDKKCYLSAIKRYLIDINLNNIYPFYEITDKFNFNHYFIKKYFIENIKKWKNNWYMVCEDIYCIRKSYIINNIHTLRNNNLFWWFLNRKKELII